MKKMLLNNISWKLLSLCLAFIMWIVIVNVDDPVVTKSISDVPVLIQNEDAIGAKDKVYEILEGDKVKVLVKGKRSVVDSLKASDILATADLSALSDWNAAPIIVSLAPGKKDKDVEVSLSGSVQMLKIVLEDKGTKQFQVSVKTKGELKEGYYLYNTEVKPNLVEVSGGVSAVNRIADARVELDISNQDQNFSRKLKLKLYDNNGDEVDLSKYQLSTDEVKVRATIWETKMVPVVVMAEGNPSYGYELLSLDYEPQTLLLAGTPEALAQVSSIPLTVDITNAVADKEYQIILEDIWAKTMPENVKIADGTTNISVKATIAKQTMKDYVITRDDIELRNVEDGYECVFDESAPIPRVSLMGSGEALAQFKVEDYIFYIDAKGYTSGKHTLTLHVEDLPQGIVVAESSTIPIIIRKIQDNEPGTPDDDSGGNDDDPEESPSPIPPPTPSETPEPEVDITE